LCGVSSEYCTTLYPKEKQLMITHYLSVKVVEPQPK
jgi:hypothetical protein